MSISILAWIGFSVDSFKSTAIVATSLSGSVYDTLEFGDCRLEIVAEPPFLHFFFSCKVQRL